MESGAEAAAGGRVSDRVAHRLRSMIACGELAPGENLPGERRLAETLGVSRVSVRAALQTLKAEGFLAAIQGGGTRVVSSAISLDAPLAAMARLDLGNLRDLADIRIILETWAARRAASVATPEGLAEIEGAIAEMDDARRRGRVTTDHDLRFHFAIAKAAASTVYIHILTVIREILVQMMEYNRQTRYTAGDDLEILAQHRAVLAAVRAGDGAAAGAAMERHLRWVVARRSTELGLNDNTTD